MIDLELAMDGLQKIADQTFEGPFDVRARCRIYMYDNNFLSADLPYNGSLVYVNKRGWIRPERLKF